MISTIAQYGELAQKRIPEIDKTSVFMQDGDPVSRTVQANIDAFAAINLRPRVLVDTTASNLATEVLGQPVSLPVLVGPVGGHTRFHEEGELATARAAGAAGSILVVSMVSGRSIEEIAKVAAGPLWFQLYVLKNREIGEIVVRRAESAGYSAVVVTVDNPGYRSPERDIANTRLQVERTYANFAGMNLPDVPTPETWLERKSKSFAWADLAWLRATTRLPIVIKGIQTAEDAWLAAKHGAAAIVVSNHGGYTLPGAAATMKILPEVVSAVGNDLEVYIDGGVRTGTDVLKARALGARAVLLGRAFVWALIAEGEAGVRGALDIFRSELIVAMSLCGVRDIRNVGPGLATLAAASCITADPSEQLERLTRLLSAGDITTVEYARWKSLLEA